MIFRQSLQTKRFRESCHVLFFLLFFFGVCDGFFFWYILNMLNRSCENRNENWSCSCWGGEFNWANRYLAWIRFNVNLYITRLFRYARCMIASGRQVWETYARDGCYIWGSEVKYGEEVCWCTRPLLYHHNPRFSKRKGPASCVVTSQISSFSMCLFLPNTSTPYIYLKAYIYLLSV